MQMTRIVRAIAVGSLIACSFQASAQSAGSGLERSSMEVRRVYRTVDVRVGFDQFSANLEKLLGKFTTEGARLVMQNPAAAAAAYKSMEGEQGLMVFGAMPHGNLMNLSGTPRKAKRYLIGNPLVAHDMMRVDFRAGLYAPLSFLVYESALGATRVEYDLPSSIFGQFGNPAITNVGVKLDEKVEQVLEKAAELSRSDLAGRTQ